MSNRRNNALILKHHPLRFRFEDHFLGKHVLRSNFIATEISFVFRISDDMCHRRVGQFIAIMVAKPIVSKALIRMVVENQ